MKEKNITALVSSFSRSYHHKNNEYKIFDDDMADKILTEEEYTSISKNMISGIKFFNPEFVGTKEEALRWIVDNQLSPSVLGRSAFCESSLLNAITIGCKQYLIFASGYDTFAYRNNIDNLKVFEIDRSEMIDDKISRLKSNNVDHSKVNFIKGDFLNKEWIDKLLNSVYDKKELSFSSLLGISYYLTKEEFSNLINYISRIVCNGSSIIFDYPTYDNSVQTDLNERLASGANEEMKSKYLYDEITKILEDNNFLIYEHLNDKEMTNNYFDKYNILNPNNKIIAPKGVSYCLAVKKE